MSLPEGWTERTDQATGRKLYQCAGEETPNFPKIPCDITAGWEHVRSKSTGKTYYKCAAGAGGKGVTQWTVPTTGCNASTQKMENAANSRGQAPPQSEQYEVIGTPLPNVSNPPVNFPRTAKLKLNLQNGTGEHSYTMTQDGGKKRRRRNTKKNRRAKNKRKSRRT